MHLPESCTGC